MEVKAEQSPPRLCLQWSERGIEDKPIEDKPDFREIWNTVGPNKEMRYRNYQRFPIPSCFSPKLKLILEHKEPLTLEITG